MTLEYLLEDGSSVIVETDVIVDYKQTIGYWDMQIIQKELQKKLRLNAPIKHFYLNHLLKLVNASYA